MQSGSLSILLFNSSFNTITKHCCLSFPVVLYQMRTKHGRLVLISFLSLSGVECLQKVCGRRLWFFPLSFSIGCGTLMRRTFSIVYFRDTHISSAYVCVFPQGWNAINVRRCWFVFVFFFYLCVRASV